MIQPIKKNSFVCIAIATLSLLSGMATAQSADQSFKNIPQQTKQTAETKATTKTNNVSNNALDKVDSASNKAFNGFTGLFKKKNHAKNKNQKTDSASSHPADSVAVLPKSSSRAGIKFSHQLVIHSLDETACGWIYDMTCYIPWHTKLTRKEANHFQSV